MNEPAAWMYPDDLEQFETSETFAQAYSVKVVSPTHGESVPLYRSPQPAAPAIPDVDWLAQVIRSADGGHTLGAGALAEKIVEAMRAAAPEQKNGGKIAA